MHSNQQSDSLQERNNSHSAWLNFTALGAAAALLFTGCGKFNDTPGGGENNFGREVNGISTMLAGIVAQQLETNANINVTIGKPGWSDANVTGSVSSNSISTSADLSLTDCKFDASGKMGEMRGSIDKSGWDWTAVQSGQASWKIERIGLKANYTLTLNAADGKIQGTLERPFEYDWTINGTYANGKVDVKVSTGLSEPNFTISGTFTRK